MGILGNVTENSRNPEADKVAEIAKTEIYKRDVISMAIQILQIFQI